MHPTRHSRVHAIGPNVSLVVDAFHLSLDYKNKNIIVNNNNNNPGRCSVENCNLDEDGL